MAWYLESWDSLAGRAFIARRSPRAPGALPLLDQSVIHVRPPFFEVEVLSSLAPAFAATRGTFQAGLFLGGEEVAFDTLDDAISFVRRGYSSGGMRPEPGGSTPPPLPPDIEPGGEAVSPEFDRSAERFDETVQGRFLSFQSIVADVAGLGAARFEWDIEAEIRDTELSPEGVIYAATVVAADLLDRCPDGPTAPFVPEWVEAWNSLCTIIGRLGILHSVNTALDQLVSSDQRRWYSARHRWDRLVPAPFGALHAFWVDVHWLWPRCRTDIDIYQALSVLPLPWQRASRYVVQRDHTPSLLTFMNAVVGYAGHDMARDRLGRSLLLFIGAAVAAESKRITPYAFHYASGVANRLLHDILVDGWRWIAEQMPDRAFNEHLEKVVADVPRTWARIRDVTAGGGELVVPAEVRKIDRQNFEELRETGLLNMVDHLTSKEQMQHVSADATK